MCLKQSFSQSKWVLQMILFMTVLLNCVSNSPNFDTTFLFDCTNFVMFFQVIG